MSDDNNNNDIDDLNEEDLISEEGTESIVDENNDSTRGPSVRPATEFVVLDPDHPLMKRFQASLKTMLSNQLERIELEDKETNEELRKRKDEHLELGNELYGVQQELAKMQAELEKIQDEYQQIKQQKRETDEKLDEVRTHFRIKCNKVSEEGSNLEKLRREMDSMALKVFYLRTAKKDVRGDIAVIRRAAEKAVEELYKAEGEKMQQDFLVDKLVEQVNRLEEEIALYEAQIHAQSEERKAVVDTLREAQSEISNIKSEQKQLLSQWHSTLIGLERRNEAYSTMTNAVKEKQDLILSLQSEMDCHQKSMAKEQETNERLSLLLNKKQGDLATVKKMLTQTQNKFMALKSEYSAYTRTLKENEKNLSRTINDKNLRQTEVDHLRKSIETEYQNRIELEEKIMEELRSKLTVTKAAEYVNKLKVQMRDKTRHLETQVTILENKISVDNLEKAKVQSVTKEYKKQLEAIEKDIADKNETINKLNVETYRNNISVERNQGTIDNLNKKLNVMIANAGGIELGPLEITINHLKKNIQEAEDEVSELEQKWLRDQQDIVKLYNQKNDLINNLNILKQKILILSQRQIRIEGSIDHEKREKSGIDKQLNQLQIEMSKLNKLIFREKDSQECLEKENMLMETDFVRGLKAEELESIQMKTHLEDIRNEKERILNDLVEAERQIMQWEKKIQLTQETRDAVDSEIGQGEMKIMKCEIHRMEVRYQQLLRQQELLIQDMEKSVSRREVIATRGEALQKVKNKATTKGGIEREIADIKRKIKQTLKNAQDCEDQMKYYDEEREKISTEIDSRKLANDELQQQLDGLTLKLDEMNKSKLAEIITLQQKQQTAKYYQLFKDRKYTRFCKTPTALTKETTTQESKTESLTIVIDRLCREYPQIQSDLTPILYMIEQQFETSV